MKELMLFILGIVFAYVVEPLLEKTMTFILTAWDVAIGNLHVKLTKQRRAIEKIQEETEEKVSHQIGFSLETEPREEDDEDDTDDG